MGWKIPGAVTSPPDAETAGATDNWLDATVWVERDLDTAELIRYRGQDGNLWLHAWMRRSDLVAASTVDVDYVDAAQLLGRELRRQVTRTPRLAGVGVLLHAGDDPGEVVLSPAGQDQPAEADV